MFKAKKLFKNEMKNVFGGFEYIRKYRDELCLSQEYMAARLGISQSTYQKIEAGTVKLTKDRLAEIARILDKQIEDFEKTYSQELGIDDIASLKEIITLQAIEIKNLQKLLHQKNIEILEINTSKFL